MGYSARLALALFLSPVALQAQSYIVDVNGGPGHHYTDLPEAVAAVPDGAVLWVRPGDYSRFTLAKKGLKILSPDRLNVLPPIGWTSIPLY